MRPQCQTFQDYETMKPPLFDDDDDYDKTYGIDEDDEDEEDGGDERGLETIESNLQVW